MGLGCRVDWFSLIVGNRISRRAPKFKSIQLSDTCPVFNVCGITHMCVHIRLIPVYDMTHSSVTSFRDALLNSRVYSVYTLTRLKCIHLNFKRVKCIRSVYT